MKTFAILLLCSVSAWGSIIPAERVGPWSLDCVGVTGGLPNSSNMTIYATLAAGATLSALNTAIQNCPSNQVVQLSTGNYTFSDSVIGKAGVVVRGTGMSNTVITFTGGGFYVGASTWWSAVKGGNYGAGASVNWTDGYSQGSSNITLSSVSTLEVGNVICLDQLNDNYFVNPNGYQAVMGGRGSDGARAMQHYAQVKAINGSVVTIWPPLAAPFWSGSLSPQAFWVGRSAWISRFGIEAMTIDGTSSAGGSNMRFETALDCWVKDVKSMNPANTHVTSWGGFRFTVRHSYFYGTQSASTMSYGVAPLYAGSWLIEDNILEKIVSPVLLQECVSGCVIGYNYTTNNYVEWTGWMMASFQSHDPHIYMNLIEGNHGTRVNLEDYHGSGSHNTIFRNRLTGWSPWVYGGGEAIYGVWAEEIDVTNRFTSSIGNLLGTAGKHTTYQSIPGSHNDNFVVYKVGVPPTAYGWPDDADTWGTFYRHLDYDTVTDSISYNSTNADVTLPSSLYLTAKPSFFGAMPWPPYNPTNHTLAQMSYTNIPAGYRAVYGVDPPAGGGEPEPPNNGGSGVSINVKTLRLGTLRVQ